jgi:hypothetical protein
VYPFNFIFRKNLKLKYCVSGYGTRLENLRASKIQRIMAAKAWQTRAENGESLMRQAGINVTIRYHGRSHNKPDNSAECDPIDVEEINEKPGKEEEQGKMH